MFTSIEQLEEETSFVKMQIVKDYKESNIRRVCFRSFLTFYIRLFDVLLKMVSQMSTSITGYRSLLIILNYFTKGSSESKQVKNSNENPT